MGDLVFRRLVEAAIIAWIVVCALSVAVCYALYHIGLLVFP